MKKISLFILLCIVFSLVLVSCASSEEGTCLLSGKSTVISKNDTGFSLYDTPLSSTLLFHNNENAKIEIKLYSTNGKTVTLSAENGETAKASAIGGKLCAADIEVDGKRISYALNETGFTTLLESKSDEIYVLRHLSFDEPYTITYPVKINTLKNELSFEKGLYFICDTEGIFSVEGNLEAKVFGAAAPNSAIELPEKFEVDSPELYINARSINGNDLTPNQRICLTEDALATLCSMPPFFDPTTETVILKDIALENEYTLPAACNIKVENSKLSGKLTVKTEKEGTISLSGAFSPSEIKVDAPLCNIEWDTPCTLYEAYKVFKAKSLNGHTLSSYKLSDKSSTPITSATLSCEGRNMTEDMVWKVKGNTLTCTYTGVVAPSELKNAKLIFETEGKVKIDRVCAKGKNSIDLTNPLGAYVTVTDENGKTSKYRIITKSAAKLPVIVIETDNNASIESKEEYVDATVSVESDFSDGLPSFAKSDAKIKGRGNSTWYWSEKKPYLIKYEDEVSLLGLNKGKRWVLLSNYNDKSLLRNYVALEMAKALDNMECYATQYPVDVFLNGEYAGVYSLGEQIEEGSERVQVVEDATSVDTGFFMEIGVAEDLESDSCFSTDYMSYVYIHQPDENGITNKHEEFISNYMSMTDKSVTDLNGYESYIDIDSLIDWLIMTEVSFNSDGAMRRSVFFKKDHDEKIEMGPVWDFDIAFGNSNTDFLNYDDWCCLATEYNYVYDNWICHLMKDEAFVNRFRLRWNEIKGVLKEIALDAIDYGESITEISADANFKKWDILSIQVAIQPEFMVQYDTYEKQVQYLRDFICDRMEWIDSQLNGAKEATDTE